MSPAAPPEVEPNPTIERQFRLAAAAALGAAFLVSIYAAFEWRSLFADATWYFIRLLVNRGFALWEPARYTVHILQQFPTILALRLGVSRLDTLAVVYGLTLQLLPLALTAACYCVIPRGEKAVFFFPLAHYLLGTMVCFFVPVVEGPVAAAYFWLLLFLISFGSGRIGVAAIVCLAIPAAWLHESAALLTPILACAAARRARAAAPGETPVLFWLLAMWFIAIALLQIGLIVHPRSAGQRRDALLSFLALGLLDWHGFNVPGLLAVVAIVAGCAIWRQGENPYRSWAVALGFGALSLLLLAATAATGATGLLFATWPAFAARNNAVAVSVPLAVLFLLTRSRPSIRAAWMRPPIAALVLFLALGQVGWQALGVRYWSLFVTDFQSVLTSRRGFVHWRDAVAGLAPKQAAKMNRLAWYWTNPLLSILLAPAGRIATMIGSTNEQNWQPFDPTKASELPRAAQFDYSRYEQTLTGAAQR